MSLTVDPASIECSKCNEIIACNSPCYQLRLGYMEIEDDFQAEEDVEYYHVDCPKPKCNHDESMIPSQHQVVNSQVYKNDVVANANQYHSDFQIRHKWKRTDYGELGLTVTYTRKDNPYDDWEDKFAFVKCKQCGAIQSV